MATERTVLVRLRANPSDFNRAMLSARAAVKGVRDEIDTTNDRTAWLAQSILGLGPALIPLGAAGIPVVAGLATQMTFAGGAAVTAALAFNGVGDALKAVNAYQLEPTPANLEKMNVAMEKLGPDGAKFVKTLDAASDRLRVLQMTAREGMFPGMEEGIAHLLTLTPQVNRIVRTIAQTMGELSADAGEGLAGPKFSAFFEYLETDARPILTDMGHTVGFLTEGFANLMVAFGPFSRTFSDGMAGMAQSFAEWSRSLDSNTSFQGFLDYLRDSGPKALDFLGSLTDAFVAILRAAAPVGDLLLPLLSRFLDVIGDIAGTPIGSIFLTAAAAMSIYGRAAALASITTGGLLGKVTAQSVANVRTAATFSGLGKSIQIYARNAMTAGAASERMAAQTAVAGGRLRTQGRAIAGTAGQVGLLALATSGLTDNLGLTNTASLALVGSLAGPWGAAVGAAVGGVLDLRHAGDDLVTTLDRLNATAGTPGNIDSLTAQIRNAKKQLDDLRNTSGVGDAISDALHVTGAALHGKGLFSTLSGDLQSEIDQATSKLNWAKVSEQVQRAAAASQGPLKLMEQGFRLTGAGARYAAMSTADFTAEINKMNQVLEGRASLRDYEAALDDFRKSLRENGKTFDINTRKGRENQGMLDNIAATALKVVKDMNKTDKIRVLSAARRDFIDAAIKGGMAEGAARRLANRVLGLNSIKGEAKVGQKGAEAAASKISNLRAEIARLRDKDVYIRVHQTKSGPHGPRVVAGGGKMVAMYPGETTGPTDDTLHARLSHDEWVIKARSASFYGDRFMSDVNEGRFPKPPGYAEGGKAGAPPVSVAAPNVTLGDTAWKVIIDGREVRALVVEEIDARDDMAGMRGRNG